MSKHAELRPIADLISGGKTIAMVMTMLDGRHQARPLTCVEVDGDVLSFLVDRESEWVRAVAEGRATTFVSIADDGANTYLSLEGHGVVTTDTTELHRLWTPMASVWFESADDPRLAVFSFTVTDGWWWDGPGNPVAKGIGLLRAFVMDDDSPLGDHGRVSTTPN